MNAILRSLIGGAAAFSEDLHPLAGLSALSVISGLSLLWVFGKVSNQEGIRAAKKRVQAYLLELRLYGDDPGMIWKSQAALLRTNLRYIGLMLLPASYLSIPMAILLFHLDAVYGMKPLPVGESAVVTVQVKEALSNETRVPTLLAPPGIRVETMAVRVVEKSQFSWRIRPERAAVGLLRFDWGQKGRWEKSIAAGDERRVLSARRVSKWYETAWNPAEDRIRTASVAWVEIPYPAATIELAGVGLHWLVWFLALSIIPAYLVKGYFGVAV